MKNNYKKMAVTKDIVDNINEYSQNAANKNDYSIYSYEGVCEQLCKLSQKSNDIDQFTNLSMHYNIINGNKIKILLKRLIRKLTYWIISPLVTTQTTYNKNMYYLNNEIIQLLHVYKDKLFSYEKEIVKLRQQVSESCEEDIQIDYLAFENKYRGSRELVKSRIERYFEYFSKNELIIDIGCGRGEFLEIASKHGISAIGVDIYKPFYDICKASGYKVELSDGIDYLNSLDDESVDGIVAIQVIEHVSSKYLHDLIKTSYNKLRHGGRIILETQNPKSAYSLTNYFYIDNEHRRPIHPETVKYLLVSNGYKLLKEEYPDYGVIRSGLIPREKTLSDEFNDKISFLNNFLYGSSDYTIIAIKEAKI